MFCGAIYAWVFLNRGDRFDRHTSDRVKHLCGCSFPRDAGPGMEVPGDSTSQGHDSVNVNGHAVSAVPCGDQHAALFDMEPTELEDLDGFQFSHNFGLCNVRFTRIVDFCVCTIFLTDHWLLWTRD